MILSENQMKIGPMKIGIVKSFSIQLTNDTTGAVTIKQIHVGCGACTTASVEKSNLQAGESTRLNITFKPNSTGKNIPKTVTITYNTGGSNSHSVIFTFLATVTE